MKNEYKKLDQIGKGSFAKVWLAEDKDKKKVVLKEYNSSSLSEARREFLFLNAIDSPNIVKAIEFQSDPPVLFQEYIEGTSLLPGNLKTKKQKNKFLAALSRTLSHLHSAGICFNDLKPENILIRNGEPVLIDLGLATPNFFYDNIFRGTPAYSAPEKLSRRINSYVADVFSFGLLAFQVMQEFLPADNFEYEDYKKLLLSEDSWQKFLDDNVDDNFLQSMLAFRPTKRPTMPKIARHYAEVSGIKIYENKIDIIKQHLFECQTKSVSKLLQNKFLTCSLEDEPDRIAENALLWLESENRHPILLKESDFIWQPQEFFKQFENKISSKHEIVDSIKNSQLTYLLQRDLIDVKTKLFKELSDFENTLIINYKKKSQLPNVDSKEVQNLVQEYQLENVQMESDFSAKPFLARIHILSLLTEEKTENIPEDIVTLLAAIKLSIPIYLLKYVFTNISNILPDLLLHPNINIKNDGLYFNSDSDKTKPKKDQLEKLFSASEEQGFYAIALQCSILLDKKTKTIELLEKYINDLVSQQYYSSAFEILQLYSREIKLSLSLQKKQAFLLRKNGNLKESLKKYEEIQVDNSSLDYAVIASDRAVILQELDQLDKARKIYEEVLPIFQNQENKNSYLRTINNMGVIDVQSNQFQKAEGTFLKLLDEAQKFGNKQFTTMSHLNLADVYLRKGEWKKSLYQAQTAAEFGRKFNRKNIEVWAQIYGIQAQWAIGSAENLDEIILQIFADDKLQEQAQLLENFAMSMMPVLIHSNNNKTDDLYKILITSQNVGDEKNQALFWYYYYSSNYIQAAEISKQFKDKLFQNFAKAFLTADARMLTAIFREFGLRNDCFGYLQNAVMINQNLDFLKFEELQNEIKNFATLHPFHPLTSVKINTETQPEQQHLDILWEIISIIHSNESFDSSMQSILAGVIRIAELERAVYYKFDNGEMLAQIGMNRDLNPLDLEKIRISRTILQETIKLGHIRFFESLQEETPFDIHSSIFGLGLRTAVCYPIIVNNEIRGVIYADATDAKEFSQQEQNLLETLFVQSRAALEKAEKIETLLKEREHFVDTEKSSFPEIIGNSKPMRNIFSLMKTVGSHNVNVLITGPTGSGKELIAKALHREYNSRAPFIAVNCAAIPENLLESELFGYTKGAFTGAIKDTKGKIEAANNGTLFLDEIGDMPPALQAKLLRVLQDRIITPLGSNKEIPVSFRIITATNQNLDQLVAKGTFREDLYFRLNVVEIELPPLSKRRDDILPLAEYFLQKFNKKFGKQITQINPKTANKLLQKDWRGNVRELENTLEKAVLLSSGDDLEADSLDINDEDFNLNSIEQLPLEWNEYRKYRKRIISQLDKKYANQLIAKTDGNVNKASKLGKIPRPQIYRILR
ncbi:MAG: sigma 54-interacting transcriptional regulator [Candidatus Cloacimonetes bacterium]|nr:sigma 54-interacting transcriptional regulator [Candidatus Cloacimonadota bacterium]MCF7812970.1 sigma 54-interacting transcriptional regulator [Candidatus Cloacimonadota bacterium]MCF7867298.1 sigma 54-interacting transcriptional regulator [Candidatus Cloacimonadota bacterium]